MKTLEYFHIHFFQPYRLIENDKATRFRNNYYNIIIVCASVISVSTTAKLIQRWILDNNRIAELKNLAHTMELNELRNQVSPHFLFNMLNNVKALIRTDPEMASTVIVKLSEFLRYQLYESNQEKTLLSSEIEFLSNFLNLERIRKDNLKVDFTTNFSAQSPNNSFIPSGLLIVFVENAIKHSADPSGNLQHIQISITTDNNNLHFLCINSKSKEYSQVHEENSGLGLVNIKRRLELLYQKKHSLEVQKLDNEFIVDLKIPL